GALYRFWRAGTVDDGRSPSRGAPPPSAFACASHSASSGGSSSRFVSTMSVTFSDGKASVSGGGDGAENVTPRISTPCARAARNSIELSRSALSFAEDVLAGGAPAPGLRVGDDIPLLRGARDEPAAHRFGRLDPAVRVDAQHGVDVERFRNFGPAVSGDEEGRSGRVREHAAASDHCHGLRLAGGPARARIENVVQTLAAQVDIALVVAGRERGFAVLELDQAEHVVRAGGLNSDAPRAAVPVSEHSQVAAGVDERAGDAV